ncbi:MAG: Aconitate hydratase A [Alphaproteobacteria bacterium MarineAlpha10_Bin3]|jgi:aconitate hydratase|nr:MAG: Aconitate hydratase A [Alphaproteobacteria bacterium MarineAlpha10_Bin3]PPR70566.1 MAG: Aconitate hydratase A [Alphaproteobacteria bacterium MarineAlpha4_Bin1]
MTGLDSLKTRRTLNVNGKTYDYFSIPAAGEALGVDFTRLPYSMKVLLENLLRHENGTNVTIDDIKAVGAWLETRSSKREIAYQPARVLLQDFTGVPAVVDLAAMRDAFIKLGGDPKRINPLSPVDLVIDHSVQIDSSGTPESYQINVDREFERNVERYEFLRWGQGAFDNFNVVPPGTGICHQVNLEYISQCVWTDEVPGGNILAYPDTAVGTDSHTTMVNGLGVLAWGVGGIEAEAVMLGQPVSMLLPEVIGFRMTGAPKEGTTATDIVLTVVQMLRARGVVGKFVEFFGPGLTNLSLADAATMANMAPEYGATCGIFPIDAEAINYLTLTGRDPDRVALVEAYSRAQGMWRDDTTAEPVFTDTLELDLATVEPSLAGPKRPQDKVLLSGMVESAHAAMKDMGRGSATPVAGADYTLDPGAIVIAAITSCTNTSNPAVLLAAGLVARNARARGLSPKPWVKTSFAPGSQVVTDYMEAAGLQEHLDAMGFSLVGYGCTTCIGNSGPLLNGIEDAIEAGDVTTGAVLSGNRNFEGRVHPLTLLNYLASPPLVVAYSLAGSFNVDLVNDSLGDDTDGNPVYLRDIWPTNQEIHELIDSVLSPEMFRARYDNVSEGPPQWQAIPATASMTYDWNAGSTYVQHPPYFDGMTMELDELSDIHGARSIALLADSITTDHISPAGNIPLDGPAGVYLTEHQVRPAEFNSFGARRGNHQIMMRGTFANIRIRNAVAPGTEGGLSKHFPSGEQMSIYDAAMRYREEGVPLVVIGGKEYGTGSSRDWAAKGTRLLGIKAVIVESFERIHRSNLVGMGVLPLQFKDGVTRETLGLDGSETFDIAGVEAGLAPGMDLSCTITRTDGGTQNITLQCRIDTADEVEYFRHGGILHYVLRSMMRDAA